MVDDIAYMGSVQGLQDDGMEETRMTGGPSGLLRACSVLPHLHYSLYGVRTLPAKASASRVIRTRFQPST